MNWEQAAAGFSAMGSEARLQVLRILIRAGAGGLAVSDLQDRTGIAPSTLAHHLRFLAGAGLIDQQREGRMVINRADFDQLDQLAQFILSECCTDENRTAAQNG